jgi:hypothetical protein
MPVIDGCGPTIYSRKCPGDRHFFFLLFPLGFGSGDILIALRMTGFSSAGFFSAGLGGYTLIAGMMISYSTGQSSQVFLVAVFSTS